MQWSALGILLSLPLLTLRISHVAGRRGARACLWGVARLGVGLGVGLALLVCVSRVWWRIVGAVGLLVL